ncbi:MAG: NUMOD3 domain-containing DNA-binding protein, partial [Ignavibacteriales bacterium]
MLRKTVEGYLYEEFIFCCCGCKKTRSKYDNNHRLKSFIIGHHCKGKINSDEYKKKMSKLLSGENNPMYG